jgi:guanosine-3',5'-bis(diphosphate) 3'-pyrophosphohydrolase
MSKFYNLNDVMKFAEEKHKDQKPYRGKSYYQGHILPVYEVCRKFSNHKDVLAAALLHDVVEDTEVTREDVAKLFGEVVADLVWRLTDEHGRNRVEKKLRTYPKIRANDYAVLIKLCDRLVNVSGALKLGMYQAEYPEFKKQLYTRGKWTALWNELDRLMK